MQLRRVHLQYCSSGKYVQLRRALVAQESKCSSKENIQLRRVQVIQLRRVSAYSSGSAVLSVLYMQFIKPNVRIAQSTKCSRRDYKCRTGVQGTHNTQMKNNWGQYIDRAQCVICCIQSALLCIYKCLFAAGSSTVHI